MPHVIVKIVGQSEKKKILIAEKITLTLSELLGVDDAYISIAVEDIKKEDWIEQVYNPDILGKSDVLYKKPDYDPL